MKNKITLNGCSGEDEIIHKLAQGSTEMSRLHQYISRLLKDRKLNKTAKITIDLLDDDEVDAIEDDFEDDFEDEDILTDLGSDESE